MFCKGKTTGTGDHWGNLHIPKLFISFFHQQGESFTDIGEMSLVIGE